MHKQRDEEARLGGVYTRSDYGQLRAFSRVLPEPPKPALVANKDRHVVRSSVSMEYFYGKENSRIPRLASTSAIRSLPTTPSRHRGRQRSTDSTLSGILKSTEKRLRTDSISEPVTNNRLTASPTRILGPREYGVPASQIRMPSPQKSGPGHKRQDSQQSVSSETDSLAGEECPISGLPTGLTSPSRNQRKEEPERQLQQIQPVQSSRSSISSELSMLYSEDEMPEELRNAMMPLADLVVEPQHAVNVGAPSLNDPFVAAPLPLSLSRVPISPVWSPRQHKAHDLFRESLEGSQRLRVMSVGQRPVQTQGLIHAPPPAAVGAKRDSGTEKLAPRRLSITIPSLMQPHLGQLSRASEPPPSPTRQSPVVSKSPNGPLFRHRCHNHSQQQIAPRPQPLQFPHQLPAPPLQLLRLPPQPARVVPLALPGPALPAQGPQKAAKA